MSSHAADWGPESPTPAQLGEFFRQIADGRITKEGLQKLLNDSSPVESQEKMLAGLIMGENIILPEDVTEAWHPTPIHYSRIRQQRLIDMLPKEKTMYSYVDNGYILVAPPPKSISLMEMHKLDPTLFILARNSWYYQYDFLKDDKTRMGWTAMKNEVLLCGLNMWEQLKELHDQRIPNIAEVVWFVATLQKTSGVKLLEHRRVRTISRDPRGGGYLSIGGTTEDGFQIYPGDDEGQSETLGIIPASKW